LASPDKQFRQVVESNKNKKIGLEVKMPKAQTKEASETAKEKKVKTNVTKEQFFSHLDSLTVLELADYIKEFEERYGVSAAAAMPMAGPGAAGPQEEAQTEEEKTEFAVVLKAIGDKKINVIKTVREVTSLGLKEAKDLVDNFPKPVREGLSKEEAEEIKAKFEAVGAEIELQ
jgi:large subunit ribosomal protein L7/L12